MQYWSACIGFIKYTAFHVDAVFCVKYYSNSENRVFTLFVFAAVESNIINVFKAMFSYLLLFQQIASVIKREMQGISEQSLPAPYIQQPVPTHNFQLAACFPE